jgi:nitroimidazol reductase NimA-like FMN-containing flavoprotein (pyridoxamine 5'-phosphate oxidase superfamily)
MVVHEMTADECRAVLRRASVARLACCHGPFPYVVPISIDFDGAHVYSYATVGQKVHWMRDNPNVCVQVDEIVDRFHWTSVLAFGRYEELPATAEHAAARERARAMFEGRPEWWQPGAAKAGDVEHHESLVYRIVVDQLTGRRAARPK